MSNKDGGGAAFPNVHECVDEYPVQGMSLRDWFAGQIACGLCDTRLGPTIEHGAHHMQVARISYAMADALLTERARGEK